ncbi:hypothetical protein DFP72DRAFT_457705 [Ephemerocybe angulata]|uniref:Uncharacterized protein n=1 Tax=Ephemerocybe angulata TaxID=980116 RepID=A0A8H6HUX0_9AGAR|nr:hypothetical protein DFP72DRAFT_457705 [Tulosesus angulatus]
MILGRLQRSTTAVIEGLGIVMLVVGCRDIRGAVSKRRRTTYHSWRWQTRGDAGCRVPKRRRQVKMAILSALLTYLTRPTVISQEVMLVVGFRSGGEAARNRSRAHCEWCHSYTMLGVGEHRDAGCRVSRDQRRSSEEKVDDLRRKVMLVVGLRSGGEGADLALWCSQIPIDLSYEVLWNS